MKIISPIFKANAHWSSSYALYLHHCMPSSFISCRYTLDCHSRGSEERFLPESQLMQSFCQSFCLCSWPTSTWSILSATCLKQVLSQRQQI
jgi:hypothetical protein